MTVTGNSPIAYRRFQGYADPALPEGQWLGSVTVSGDASGGTVNAILVFSEALAQLSSRFFNVEELGLSISSTSTTTLARIQTDNLGRDGPAAFQHRMFVSLQGVSGIDTVQVFPRDLAFLPIVLGAMRVIGVQTTMTARVVNPGVGDDVRFEAAGYWWGSRSILVDGGPRRPPNGLYRA